jgi:hypothetical protein
MTGVNDHIDLPMMRGRVNHSELIRRAYRYLGTNAKKSSVITYVKKKYSVDLDPITDGPSFSKSRTTVIKETVGSEFLLGITAVNGKDEKLVSVVANTPEQPIIPSAPVDVSNMLNLIDRTQQLILLCGGKDNLKRLIDKL